MQLSDYTKKVLQNYLEISERLVILKKDVQSEGTRIQATSKERNAQMVAIIPEKFDEDVFIHDFSMFLGVVNAYDKPDLTFANDHVVISGAGQGKMRITYADPAAIIYEHRTMELPSVDVTFELSEDALKSILKFADIGSLTEIRILVENGKLLIKAVNPQDPGSKDYTAVIGDYDGQFAPVHFDRDKFKMLPGDYRVEVCPRMAKFTHLVNKSLCYMMAARPAPKK